MSSKLVEEANWSRRGISTKASLFASFLPQVFVANPKKPLVIENILRRNRDRLVQYLTNFHNDKDDEQFVDEKQYVLQIIESTGKPSVAAA
jgi:hypothetical protein